MFFKKRRRLKVEEAVRAAGLAVVAAAKKTEEVAEQANKLACARRAKEVETLAKEVAEAIMKEAKAGEKMSQELESMAGKTVVGETIATAVAWKSLALVLLGTAAAARLAAASAKDTLEALEEAESTSDANKATAAARKAISAVTETKIWMLRAAIGVNACGKAQTKVGLTTDWNTATIINTYPAMEAAIAASAAAKAAEEAAKLAVSYTK